MKQKNKNSPVEVFAGDPWETSLVKSLLENAGLKVFLKDEATGSLTPFYSGVGGRSAVKIVVSETDIEEAKKVIDEYRRNMTKE